MSAGLTEFIKRLATDPLFAQMAHNQPDIMLPTYSLSQDEERAIRELLKNPPPTGLDDMVHVSFWG